MSAPEKLRTAALIHHRKASIFWTEHHEKKLSPEQAFRAMFIFLSDYYERTHGKGELGAVLSDIQTIGADGLPADPAAWGDWLAAIDLVFQESK
jgi:hypothetical protein